MVKSFASSDRGPTVFNFLFESLLLNFIPFVMFFAVGAARSKLLGLAVVFILGMSLVGNTLLVPEPDWAVAIAFVIWGLIGFILGWSLRFIWQKKRLTKNHEAPKNS